MNQTDYSTIYPLLKSWDIQLGGFPPTADEIEAAHKCGYKPGAIHTLALALGFRHSGSIRAERRYVGRGKPRENVGALGDLMRAQHVTAEWDAGQSLLLQTKSGEQVRATSFGNGHWKFELLDALTIGREQAREEFLKTYDERFAERVSKISDTERTTTIKQRTCQGILREFLLQSEQTCQVTGLDVPELLRASHIRPWADPRKESQMEPNNVLLLAAHLDAAFDKHLISFDERGRILISNYLNSNAREMLGLSPEMRLRNHGRHETFLNEHRAKVRRT